MPILPFKFRVIDDFGLSKWITNIHLGYFLILLYMFDPLELKAPNDNFGQNQNGNNNTLAVATSTADKVGQTFHYRVLQSVTQASLGNLFSCDQKERQSILLLARKKLGSSFEKR